MADSHSMVREELDSIAADSSLSHAEKRARLRAILSSLQSLAGETQRLLSDSRLMEEAASSESARRVLSMRANADAHDHLVEQGHDPEELAKQGFVTHAHIDQLAEEGLLAEAAEQWPVDAGDDEGDGE